MVSPYCDSEVETNKSGFLDFGDLPGGSSKSLPLKLVNKTHATVPVRLVISAVSTHCLSYPAITMATMLHML